MSSELSIEPVKIPQPHFDWGQPTVIQQAALARYIQDKGAMSIYGDEGIYEELESRLADLYKLRYVILTNTGTSALNSAFVGIGIQEGDEVVVPTYTFLATVTPLLRLRAMPVFADADPVSGGIDPKDIERKITRKTKAIALTHMWGVACDMEAVMAIAQAHNLKVVEDCSHAHFTMHKGKMLGTYGDAACLSIGARKTLTSGEGGFMVTNDPEIYMRATLLGHFEVRAKQALRRLKDEGHQEVVDRYTGYETGLGENYRMHPYSAVMANALLKDGELFELIQKRAQSLKYFTEELQNNVTIIEPPVYDEDFYTGAMYGYRGKIRRDLLKCSIEDAVEALRGCNVSIKLQDAPLHQKAIFHGLKAIGIGYGDELCFEGDFAGAAHYMDGRVTLPTFSRGLAEDRELIDEYIRVFKAFEAAYKR